MKVSRSPQDIATAKRQIQWRTRRSKYRAAPTVVYGIRFASKAEARRFGELKMLEKAGAIVDLKLQSVWKLFAAPQDFTKPFVCVGKYVSDFSYETRGGELVVEDVKGLQTELSRWKLRHFEAQYGFPVQIVKMT